ncbi:bifunctional diaminohydroxyphosphoribosylaminopyrimidine deaminase/5-amino-6-(5-phosphoribosylamino)uracil reductase RibD [Granulicella sibirica]|nr:bifunctional diaminohydroxyphosphoribosylaminopyrimidine deaminase/5-amino-6-(5-phosphoribosylamino)uracil reductase RibD [Granulicella sibirica]
MDDEHFMQRALALASETIGLASPNPYVGCVLVRDGEIFAEGAHLYDQYDHAEIVALKQAAAHGIDPTGSTAYVTLEPCSHHGRTGPCADALITAKVSRIVVATQDPNPQVSGQGIARLRAAGIDATVGVLQQAARDLNDAFAHFILRRRPLVTLKAALSVDGKLAPPPRHRAVTAPHWLTGPAARANVQRLRHASDAILTGIGTILADNPSLGDRAHLPRRRPLLRVILDSALRIPMSSEIVRSTANDVLLLCSEEAPGERIEALQSMGVEVETIPSHSGHLSLEAVLDALARRTILSLLVEAGSALNGSFISQNLVDKAVLFYSETELGADAIPFAAGVGSPYLFEQRFKRITRTTFEHGSGEDARVTGYLRDSWNPSPA